MDLVDTNPNGSTTTATRRLLIGTAVVLIGVNLRPAITSVGPLLDRARDSFGASAMWAGLLTTVPVLCFAPAGLAAPAVARRLGMVSTVGISLCMVGGGCVLRTLDGPVVVIGGTLVAAAGIALASVLAPVVIKLAFPSTIGMVTGIYTASLQAGATLGFVLTPVLDGALGGWRLAWASWSILAVIALAAWLVAALKHNHSATTVYGAHPQLSRSLLRSRLAWIVTVFFGLQAFVAFVVIGWLPQVLMDVGIRPAVPRA